MNNRIVITSFFLFLIFGGGLYYSYISNFYQEENSAVCGEALCTNPVSIRQLTNFPPEQKWDRTPQYFTSKVISVGVIEQEIPESDYYEIMSRLYSDIRVDQERIARCAEASTPCKGYVFAE